MTYRTKSLDYDARPQPKTERYCSMCQRDIKPSAKAREVHLVDGGMFVLHPDDESLYPTNDPGDLGVHLLGMRCARRLGLEWSRPENDWTKTESEPDAECTQCGLMFFSGDGPAFNLAVCRACFSGPGMGPKVVVS